MYSDISTILKLMEKIMNYPKYHYDGAYLGMTQGDNLRVYEPGDEFNYNGNLYTMDENGHINVPYGEDIFHCLSRPKGKYAIK